jgi:hypothetical protein
MIASTNTTFLHYAAKKERHPKGAFLLRFILQMIFSESGRAHSGVMAK